MTTYVIKRILLMIPTLFLICFLSYGMIRLAPGDPTRIASGSLLGGGTGAMQQGESEAAKAFRSYYHLDKPWYVGFWYWFTGDPQRPEDCKGVLRGDFGRSIMIERGRPVWELVKNRLPVTIKLNLWAILLIYLISIPAGIYAAVRHNGLFDRASSFIFFLLYSLPSFWIGLLLIIAVSKWVPGWPIGGLHPEVERDASYWEILGATAKHYVLPVFCMSYAGFAGLSRYARVSMLDVIRQDYIRTARAKGLSEATVVLKHALRNALIPLITIFAGLLPGLVGGSLVIEYLFNIQGMGTLGLEAISKSDYPVLMILFGMGAALTLIGILIADLLYCVADPRITLE